MKSKLPAYKAPSNDYVPKTNMGAAYLTTRSMQPPAKTACAECPLRRDSKPGYLGGYTPEMFVEYLHSPASVACHLTGPGGPVEEQRHCVGACAYRANVGHVPSVLGVPTAAQTAIEAVGKDPQFFQSPEEFLHHHKNRKRLR